MNVEAWIPVAALLVGSAGVAGILTSLAKLRRQARLKDRAKRDLELAESFDESDAAHWALVLSARSAAAELAAITLARHSTPARLILLSLGLASAASMGLYCAATIEALHERGLSAWQMVVGTSFEVYSPLAVVFFVLSLVSGLSLLFMSDRLSVVRAQIARVVTSGEALLASAVDFPVLVHPVGRKYGAEEQMDQYHDAWRARRRGQFSGVWVEPVDPSDTYSI